MEMQRIDANTIRVLIDQDDLDARGITMLDLLGNQNQIEDFFYSILEEVDTDHQFHKNDSVTFQALPTKKGLELLITKGSPREQANKQHVSRMIQEELRGHDSVKNIMTLSRTRIKLPTVSLLARMNTVLILTGNLFSSLRTSRTLLNWPMQ